MCSSCRLPGERGFGSALRAPGRELPPWRGAIPGRSRLDAAHACAPTPTGQLPCLHNWQMVMHESVPLGREEQSGAMCPRTVNNLHFPKGDHLTFQMLIHSCHSAPVIPNVDPFLLEMTFSSTRLFSRLLPPGSGTADGPPWKGAIPCGRTVVLRQRTAIA